MKPKIIVIVGPTASGKTSLSIRLAKKFNGEVISADSRQIDRGLDIGTGKITKNEMDGIPHHLLDVYDPNETYTAADYVRDGREKIAEILTRNNLPIIVGGTAFYIDALLGRISTPEVPPNLELREKLEVLSTSELFAMLKERNPLRAETIDADNKRRLVRALEITEALGNVPPPQPVELYSPLILGISISKEVLQVNIHKRLLERLDKGMIDEVRNLHANGLSYDRMEELGLEYKYIAEFLQGKITEAEMCALIETKSLQYAKRQMTWLKRDKEIVWVDLHNESKISNIVEDFIKSN